MKDLYKVKADNTDFFFFLSELQLGHFCVANHKPIPAYLADLFLYLNSAILLK